MNEFNYYFLNSKCSRMKIIMDLSIVKQLVEQIGGDISVRSEGKNKGSTFELTLVIEKPGSMLI